MPNTALRTNIGTGATGLIADANVVHGEINRLSRDTGWRNVLPLFINGWTATAARIRRVDHSVIFEVTGLDSSASTSNAVIAFGSNEATELSSRFAPDIGRIRTPVFESASQNFQVHIYLNPETGLNASFSEGTLAHAAYPLQVSWHTFLDWPTFLPPAV